jgi:hypothetical protein
MPSGYEGLLTLTVKVGVSPEPRVFRELMSLMHRYREGFSSY